MKKKTVCMLLVAGMLSLGACGQAEQEPSESPVIESETVAEETTESVTEEKEQTIVEYREQLELEQVTDYSTERQQELSGIMVDVKDEKADVQQQAAAIYDFVKQGYSAEILAVMDSPEWKSVMFPSLIIGQRNYYLKVSDTENVRFLVAADEVGNECSAVLYSGAEGQFFYVEKNSEQVKVVSYQQNTGSFVSEMLRVADGYYVKYAGTLDAENYVLTGNFTAHVGTLSMGSGVVSAWNSRSEGLTEYAGEFNETGRSKIVTPNQLKNAGQLAYATHSQRRGADYLSVATDADADEYSFFGDFAGLFTVWGRLQ